MGELIDVVDDHDHVLGQATRAEVRARNHLHRAVYLLVHDGRGRIFVHRRTETKDVYPGRWDVTVGGVVAAGEAYTEAAVRELGEELGIYGVAVTPLGPVRFADAATRVLGRVFLAAHAGPVILQAEEIASGAFMTLAEADRLLATARCCPDGALALRTYRARLPRITTG